MASHLTKRVAFAALAIPAVLGIAYLGGWALVALLAVASALGTRELYGFARAQGIEPLDRLGLAGAALTPVIIALPVLAPSPVLATVRSGFVFLVWLLLVIVTAVWRRGPGARPLTAVAVTVFGALYAGWLLSFALLLRHPGPRLTVSDASVGLPLLFFPLVLTWAGDTAAMFGGQAFGGPKLAPVVSPNKTWSGGISGLFATTAVAVMYAATVLSRGGIAMSVTEAVIAGVVIGVAGQVGDVAESLFKREAGLKDSSSIIPGHGGVLDRLDSLYFAVPVAVLLFRAFGLIS